MQFLQDENEALILDALVVNGQRLARFQLFEHIVHLRERQARMLRLPRFAMRVQFSSNGTDVALEAIGAIGEGKWIEAARLRVARIIPNAEPPTSTKCPCYVNAR